MSKPLSIELVNITLRGKIYFAAVVDKGVEREVSGGYLSRLNLTHKT